jgi:hypothetical protein
MISKVGAQTILESANSTMYFWAIGSPCPARTTGRAARKVPTHGQTGAILKRVTGKENSKKSDSEKIQGMTE